MAENSSIWHVLWGSPIPTVSPEVRQVLAGTPFRPIPRFEGDAVRYRLKLRMPFRDWSRAVDRDGLAGARSWLKAVEDKLNARP